MAKITNENDLKSNHLVTNEFKLQIKLKSLEMISNQI